MPKSKMSKSEAREQIDEFFNHIRHKTPEDVRKIKNLAMSHNIKLGDKRKLFCKNCLSPYKRPSISIKNDRIRITCDQCGYENRWKLEGELNFGLAQSDEGGCC